MNARDHLRPQRGAACFSGHDWTPAQNAYCPGQTVSYCRGCGRLSVDGSTGLDQAVLAKMTDLRLRIVQARALTNMLHLRPELAGEIVPKLAEALDAPPTVEDRTGRWGETPAHADAADVELCLDCGARITTHPDGTQTVEVRS